MRDGLRIARKRAKGSKNGMEILPRNTPTSFAKAMAGQGVLIVRLFNENAVDQTVRRMLVGS